MKRVPASRYALFLILVTAGVIGDLYSKSSVFESIGYPQKSSDWTWRFVDGWLTFRLFTNFNEGALWGIGQGYAWLFAGLSVVAILGVLYWLFVVGAGRSWWLTIALALIMAGTLGNLYDRLAMHGCLVDGIEQRAVRDFLLFTFGNFHWPVFNFADVFLVTGAVMMVLHSFKRDDSVLVAEIVPAVSSRSRNVAEPTVAESTVAE